jgi:glutathione S-transferase
MKILFSPFSPYVRKCLVTAHELGLDHAIQLLPSNAHPVNRDRQIIETNPLGKVPTFYTDDGQVLYDSRVICEYLNSLAGGDLFPASGRQRWSTLTLQSLGDGILDAALLARYEDVARPEQFRFNDWKLAQMDKFETSLTALNNEPGQLADRVDIGTLTVGCALWYLDLRFSDIAWRDRYPKVASWYLSFGQRPSMSAVWSLS